MTRTERASLRAGYLRPSIRVNRYASDLPKVIVLHDLSIVPELVRLMLTGRAEVVAETISGRAAVALCELFEPDVVVVGDMLVDGVAEYYVPALVHTGARVIMVPEPGDTARFLEFVELGATGIVDTDRAPQEMAEALLVLASGGAVLPHDVVAAIAAEWRRLRRKGPDGLGDSDLTAREIDVLGAMSDGLSSKAIAHHLGIAVKTVENHKTRIFDKLGVHTQAQAVAIAIGSAAVSREADLGREAP